MKLMKCGINHTMFVCPEVCSRKAGSKSSTRNALLNVSVKYEYLYVESRK